MAHKTHNWSARSLQADLTLQHVALTWECKVRGCWLTTTHTYTFRKPPGMLDVRRAKPGPDWVRKEH